MKVTNNNSNSLDKLRDVGGSSGTSRTSGVSNNKDKKNSVDSAESGGPVEKVAISGRAKEAAKIKDIASSAEDIDNEKVARLKAALKSGAYKVDADKVADRLVDDHLFNSI